MRKLTFILLPFVVVLVGLFYSNRVYSSEHERIQDLSVQIVILDNGQIDISENIKYYFPYARHGIRRKIPYIKVNNEGKKFKMAIKNYSVFDETGKKYQFEKSVEGGDVVLKIGDPNRTVSGTVNYIISYTVSGALTYFSEHDELYWNAVGTSWEVPIDNASVLIKIPRELGKDELGVECFTGKQGSSAKDCGISGFDRTDNINLSSTGPLDYGEGLAFVVGFPKGMVEVLEPEKDRSDLILYFIVAVVLVAALFWYLIYPIRVFLKWYKDYKATKNARIVAAWFEPPQHDNGTNFSPAETSVLVDKSVDHKDLTATLIQLAQKGYIIIRRDENDKYEIEIIDGKPDTGLKNFEKHILDTVKEHAKSGVLKLSDVSKSYKFGKDIMNFNDKVSSELVKKGIFVNDPHKAHTFYTGMGVGAFSTLNILLALVSLIFGRKSALKSEKGVEKYGEAVSMKNFLVSQDTQLDFQAKNQMFFEKLLPYATAFGVEDIWAKRFSDLQMKQPDWFVGDNFTNASYTGFTHSLGRSFVSSTSRASSTSSSSGFSSGFSGGSSGGGGGGGGGGSW